MAGPTYRLIRRGAPENDSAAPTLDDAQRAVVDHRGGPLLVLAGPGTGKTTTLVESVVDRVRREEVTPEQVLVLTFGRRAAAEIRDRVAARLRRTIREPVARTFHSYAYGLLRREAALRGAPAPRLLSGPEQDLMIRDLLTGDVEEFGAVAWPDRLRPALRTRGFSQELRDLLLRAAERGVDPATLHTLGRRLGRDDWAAAARFARQYTAVTALRPETPSLDPAELVRAACDLLRSDAELLERERLARAVVLVDEYQDCDPAQAELLRLLAGGGRDLVVVGDPDQSIYAFRGAELEEIRRFNERFARADGGEPKVVSLETSRRASGRLLEASRRVASRLGGPPAHRRLIPASDVVEGDVEVHLLRSTNSEAAYAAQRLREAHLVDGVAWSRMAVLVRSAGALGVIRRACASAGVPTATRLEDLPLVDQPAVRPLLRLLELATGRRELDAEVAVELVCGPFGNADPLALRRLRQELRRHDVADERAGDAGGWDSNSANSAASNNSAARADTPVANEEAVTTDNDAASPAASAAPAASMGASKDTAQVTRSAGPRPSLQLLVEAIDDPRRLLRLDDHVAAPALRIGHLLATAREAVEAVGATAETVLWAMWSSSERAEPWARTAVSSGSVPSASASAADRDLDAVTALFDAAARFVDRMPAAGPEVFLDHLLGQEIPADTLAPRAPEGEAVQLATAHAAKGAEWDVVIVPAVQDGTWPDLRVRGTLLGSEALVDAVSDRDGSPAVATARTLAEERRLFYVAVTRARRRLIVTAVSGEEEQPSRFLDELLPWSAEGTGEDRPFTKVPRGLDLAAIVAELRSVVCSSGAEPHRRSAAAHQLARLAAAGVRGADPSSWYGLPELSDDAPLREPDEPVRVSPSRVEAFNRCGLRWLLESCGGRAADSLTQGVGSLVHDLAHEAAIGQLPIEEMATAFEERWTTLGAGTGWYADKQHEQARAIITRLTDWLRSNPRALVAAEQAFEVAVGRAVISGRVDRLERDANGRLIVVDLKTGKSKPAAAELDDHPQLGTYQLAVEYGGFDTAAGVPEVSAASDSTESPDNTEGVDSAGATAGEARPAGSSGGALLVQLGSGAKAAEQVQRPLAEACDPGWAERLVATTADGMAGSVFTATENRWCQVCPVRRSCPVHGEGGQVTP